MRTGFHRHVIKPVFRLVSEYSPMPHPVTLRRRIHVAIEETVTAMEAWLVAPGVTTLRLAKKTHPKDCP
jgi:hypothetical protein